MADMAFKLEAAPLLGGVEKELAGCVLKERDDLVLVSLAVPREGMDPFSLAMVSGFGLELPSPTRSVEKDGFRLMQSTADSYLMIFAHPTPDAADAVKEKLGDTAYYTEQTDGWIRLELSGARAREALERLCPLDLHDSAFPVGSNGRTSMEHMGTFIIRTDEESWLLLSLSSSGESFLHAVETSLKYIG